MTGRLNSPIMARARQKISPPVLASHPARLNKRFVANNARAAARTACTI